MIMSDITGTFFDLATYCAKKWAESFLREIKSKIILYRHRMHRDKWEQLQKLTFCNLSKKKKNDE